MLFWLKKIATVPFLPLYFSLIAGSLGLFLLCFVRRQKLGRLLISCGVFALALFSNQGVAMLMLAPLENDIPALPDFHTPAEVPARLSRCKAIVVLGGGHADAPQISRINQLSTSSLSRIGEAVRLSRWLPEAKFVVSGHHIKTLSHAQVLGEAAVSLGVDPGRIVRLDEPRDTEDEIVELSRRFRGRPIALVTSAWHMPRTLQLCEKFGVEAVPCPADLMLKAAVGEGPNFIKWDLESLGQSTRAIHEYLGMVWIKLRG
jgi:uncharacterized SAM-binding protein YcdF (DUF218 family)